VAKAGNKGALLAWILLLAAALGALYVCFERVTSMFGCWRWEIADGREGPNIYALWRVLHGHPLYDLPNHPPYTLTLYNFGFYHFYAGVMRLLGADDEALLAWPRVLTASGGVLGAVLFGRLAHRLAPAEGALERSALASLCFVVWFGTQFFSWWPFDIRPDIWSLTLALAGLALVLRALELGSVRLLIAASGVFWLAWSFKQSTVWTLAGSLVAVLVLTRKVKNVVALAAPFAVLAAAALLAGGQAYRVSLLVAPALSAWHAPVMLEVLSRSLLQNAWPFGFCVVALAGWAWERRQSQARALPDNQRALLIVGAVAFVLGGISTGRVGANKNYLFEAYLAFALASWVALERAVRRGADGRFQRAAAVVLLVPWVLLPLAQIRWPGRFGRTTLCTAEDSRQLASLADLVSSLPKPLYADHDVFSQPWQATGNRYPAFVMDGTWADVAQHAGFLRTDYLDRLFREGRFASGMFYEGDPEVARLASRGAACRVIEQRPFLLTRVVCGVPKASTTVSERAD
jgi:hypothetical protein